jgi:hypothetical protein
MKTDFKSVPWGIYVAVVILVLCYIMVSIAFPLVMLVLTATAAIVLSFLRICHYLMNGN